MVRAPGLPEVTAGPPKALGSWLSLQGHKARVYSCVCGKQGAGADRSAAEPSPRHSRPMG